MKIQELQLFTSRLQEQFDFYGNVLKLPILEKTDHNFKFEIGYSMVEFMAAETAKAYHLAFHIGAKQEKDALVWLQEKVKLLKHEENEIIDFPSWKAKSLYFYDADKNIIEFISRENQNLSKEKFSQSSIFGVAEIGLASGNIEEKFKNLHQFSGLEIYFGTPDVFCAVGDDDGLFIMVDKNEKTWFPTDDKALPADFSVKFKSKGKTYHLNYQNQNLVWN